ncbi:MAG: hypothetical protein GY950_37480 [bacterium]|nr:hypothetical protein [bacterium]
MIDNVLIKNRAIRWTIVFAFFTVFGLMKFSLIITERLASGYPVTSKTFRYPFVNEMTGSYAVLLLLPLLLWFFKKFPITRKNLFSHIPLYVVVSMLIGSCHTGLMWLSRKVIYKLANMGDFDYGRADFRLLMEYHHQIITFWVVFGIVSLVRYVKKNQEEKLRLVRLEEALTKARLQALQMQLNPHFLFNTLNMISSTMYEDAKAADKMIASLSDLLRLTLDSNSSEEYKLEKELEVLSLYIEIMKARFGDKLKIDMEIGEGTRGAMVPGFILQPLVENSIKYGMEGLETTGVRVISRREGELLVLEVRDNGPGIVGNVEEVMSGGVGLSNTVERLEKLYGTEHRFLMENIDGRGGFRVQIEIPFRI